MTGLFWNIEIYASVAPGDTVRNWSIHQDVWVYYRGTFLRENGESPYGESSVHRRDGIEEIIYPSNYVKNPFDQWLFWINSPGQPTVPGVTPYNLSIRIEGRSWIQKGKTGRCEVNWVLEFVWKNGRMTKYDFSSSS